MGFSISDADEYFKPDNHIAGALWNDEDEDKRKAALAYARRILERTKGTELDEPDAGAGNDEVREDYALFEQALWTLTNSPYLANAEGTAQGFQAQESDGEPRQRAAQRIAPQAAAWMGWNMNFLVRG